MKHTNQSSDEDYKKERLQLLKQLQNYPLELKVSLTRDRIREFMDKYPVYFSFSGGKDSQVLLHIGAQLLKDLGYCRMHVVYVNTGLEYLSVRHFVAKYCSYIERTVGIIVNLHELQPRISFVKVLKTIGYPIISKEVTECIREARKGIKNDNGTYQYRIDKLNGVHKDKNGNLSSYNMSKYRFLLDSPIPVSEECCDITKKEPAKVFEAQSGLSPIIATMASESRLRRSGWIHHGCNMFEGNRPKSNPMSFWHNNDVLTYIYRHRLSMADAYGNIISESLDRNGQMDIFDCFGISYDGCRYHTSECSRTGCVFCLFGIMEDTDRILRLQKLEPQRVDYILRGGAFDDEGFWRPDKRGLGYWFILEYLKKYGDIDIPYEGNYGKLEEFGY